jgi:cell wall-associated NlpC family hydrolase
LDVQLARQRAVGRTSGSPVVRLRYLLLAVVALVAVLGMEVAQPVAASSPSPSPSAPPAHIDAAHKIIAAATRHLGAPYRFGADGPRTFDCSGFVFRVFKDTGELRWIGGSRTTVRGYMDVFQRRGQASRTNGQPGDLVVYNHGEHIGIYIGNGWVISAIYDGVTRHKLRHLTIPFTEFLHTHVDGAVPTAHHRHHKHHKHPKPHAGVVRAIHGATLRAAPRHMAAKIERIHRGTSLHVSGHQRDGHGNVWLHVTLPDHHLGWVRKSFTHTT